MPTPSNTKTLSFSPLDIWLLYFTLHQWRPIQDRRSLLKHIADALAQHGWALTDYKMGKWYQGVTMSFAPAEGNKTMLHDWQTMLRVRPFAVIGYQALDMNGNAQPIMNEDLKQRALMSAIGLGAFVILIAIAARGVARHTAAPTPPSVAHVPAPVPAPAPPPPPPVAAPEPTADSGTVAPAPTFEKPKRVDPSTLPDPVKITLSGMTGEQTIAQNAFDTYSARKAAPVVYVETSYRIDNGGNIVTTDRWWFNFRDGFVQNDAFDYTEGRVLNPRSRVLMGETEKRMENARLGGGFKLAETEQWTLGPPVATLVFQKAVAYYRANGFGPDLIAKIAPGKTADEIVMTVTDAWKALPQPERLAKAQELWQQWYVTRYPVGKDYAFLRLVDAKGNKQGGSGPLGAAIYVVP